MSFDKDYPNRKDHRAPYIRRGAGARGCRPNGGCPYCEGSRAHADAKRRLSADEQMAEELSEMEEMAFSLIQRRAQECYADGAA